MKHIDIYTDGACSGNPGAGGWGTILVYNGHEKELSGGAANTTNNRMEMMAVIEGLKALKEPCEVTLTSDSQYICNAVSRGWAKAWKKNHWFKSDRTQAKNIDLWEELLTLLDVHQVTVEWVRGHNGHPYNERCDRLAVEQAKKYS